jgi:hypothetical protein
MDVFKILVPKLRRDISRHQPRMPSLLYIMQHIGLVATTVTESTAADDTTMLGLMRLYCTLPRL